MNDDMDMKIGPITKLERRTKTTSKNMMSANCDVIVIFPIYGQFGVIQKPDSARRVRKTKIFINSNFLS